MIFITVGSQKFQFNRLLKAIDELVAKGKINDRFFAQTGYSDYTPLRYEYKQFLDHDEYDEVESEADIIITHGGTGTIVGAVKKGKKVIAVPRLKEYGEHVDDHQLQLIAQFVNNDLIAGCNNLLNLEYMIIEIKSKKFNSYKSNTDVYINKLDMDIKELVL